MPESLGRIPASEANLNPKKILFGKYELGRLLGCGAFAKVYHARNLSNGHSVAIKIIQKSRIAKPGLTKNILREVSILCRHRHPNIVRLYEVLASKKKIYLLLEFAKGGELFAKVANAGKLDEDLSRKYFRQLISAVGYCHARGVFHRDLKPENLLLDEFGDLLVSDFGLAALPEQIRPDGLLHTVCGTPAYVAPEILTKKGYDGAKVDVWSCGVILFVLNAGYLPFNDSNLMNMYRKIYRGEYRIPKWTSPELRRLISGILDTNPETRMTVDEIINDPWFGKGMGKEERTALMQFHYEEAEEEKVEEEERELNAFDIIGFATDLSGLFDSDSDSVRERFVSGLSAEGILGRAEEVGRSEGLFVRRGKMGLVLEGHNGNLGLRVRVHRLTADVSVVEVEKGGEVWAQDLWREKVGPTIRGRG